MNLPRSTFRRLGLGRLALALWHQPVGRMRNSLRNGGPLAERETERQRREMEAAALQLPALPTPPADSPLQVHLLTGRRFWYQTAFCVHSLVQAAREPFRCEVYDDGSLDAEHAARLLRLGPAIRIHSYAEVTARVDCALPASRFPAIRERWRNYPNLRKLTDVHAGSEGWKLVLDSDLLFFREPRVLLNWLHSPDRPLHAIDCEESYGYSRLLLEQLAGTPLAAAVNVGLCGLHSESLDWDKLERWIGELQSREGTNYFLEQALVAMHVAGRECAIAPALDYLTRPEKGEVLAPTAVMHHYVANSKRWYFRHGWRQVAPRTAR